MYGKQLPIVFYTIKVGALNVQEIKNWILEKLRSWRFLKGANVYPQNILTRRQNYYGNVRKDINGVLQHLA
jgi:hypothetical protein